jgi:hypothetical protein
MLNWVFSHNGNQRIVFKTAGLVVGSFFIARFRKKAMLPKPRTGHPMPTNPWFGGHLK